MRGLFFLVSLIMSIPVFAQVSWYDLLAEQGITYEAVYKAYQRDIKGLNEEGREAHAKHFNRWKMQVKGYVKPDGQIMSSDERAEAWNTAKVAYKKSNAGRWNEIGPFTANDVYRGVGRINCVAFHPTDSNIMYCGAPYGGVWKTVNHGNTWENLTDDMPSFGVSALAVDPENPDIVYAGTGDGETGRNPGFGVWKSTDAGKTWEQKNNTMNNVIVQEILVFPDNTDEVIASTWSGIYKSTNGGETWINVNVGNTREMRFHPEDPEVIYAVTNGAFFVSENRGRRWERKLLPKTLFYRMSLAVSAAEPDAVFVTGENGILKSEKRGDSLFVWDDNDGTRDLGSQSWYNHAADASPTDAGTIYQGHVPTYATRDGGKTWGRLSNVHSDIHHILHSPVTGRLWVAGDGGIVALNPDGKNFTDYTNMGVSEIYKMSQHPSELDHILNGYQDCGSKYYIGSQWLSRVGADGMDCVFDPDSPDIYFTTIQYGDIRRHFGGPDGKVSNFPDPQGNKEGERGPWVSPIWLDKKDPNILYTAQHSVYRYLNAREDKPKRDRWQKIDNGLPGAGEFSEFEQNETALSTFYVANGAFLYRTRNMHTDEPEWENLANNYPRSSAILDVESSANDSNLLFMSMGQRVHKSEDGGDSFTEISDGLPQLPVNSLQLDAVTGHLYAGCGVGVYVLLKGDTEWIPFSEGLSLNAPVYELEIFYNEDNHDESMIKAATYGRGMWESSLYGSFPDPDLPFYAVLRGDGSKLLETTQFSVEVSFRRGISFVDVKELTANAFELVNCKVVEIKGQKGLYQVMFEAENQGELSIHIPADRAENANLDGQLNLASGTIEKNFLKDGTHFGFEGPGGVGSPDQIAVWLEAEDLTENHNTGDEIFTWTDKLDDSKKALRNDTLHGPLLWQSDTLFNGMYALSFDSLNQRKIVVDSITTSYNITAITVAASDAEDFNEHAWMGSCRTENGFIIHPWRDHKYARMYAYDSLQKNIRSAFITVEDPRKANIYGLSYRNDIYIWNYTNDRAESQLVSDGRPRKEQQAIDINLGWDKDERYGDGKIATHLVYNEALMLSHRTLVYNYLASRFGVEIPEIDRYSFEDGFGVGMAGIGKESAIDFHDDARGTGIMRISNPKGLDDKEYLMWGSNGKPLASWQISTAVDGFESSFIEWKFDETGDVGEVLMRLPKDQFEEGYNYFISLTDTNGQNQLRLLSGDDEGYAGIINPSKGSILGLMRTPSDNGGVRFEIFPNPISADGRFTIYYLNASTQDLDGEYRLYDLRGRLVSNESFVARSGELLHEVEIPQLQKSGYILKATIGDNEFLKRISVVE